MTDGGGRFDSSSIMENYRLGPTGRWVPRLPVLQQPNSPLLPPDLLFFHISTPLDHLYVFFSLLYLLRSCHLPIYWEIKNVHHRRIRCAGALHSATPLVRYPFATTCTTRRSPLGWPTMLFLDAHLYMISSKSQKGNSDRPVSDVFGLGPSGPSRE